MPGLFSTLGEPVVLVLRQTARQLRLVRLDSVHRLLDRLGDVPVLWKVEQIAVTRVVGKIETALGKRDLV